MRINRNVLFIASSAMENNHQPAINALRRLSDAIVEQGFDVSRAWSVDDAFAELQESQKFSAIGIYLNKKNGYDISPENTIRLVDFIRKRNPTVPIFILSDENIVAELPIEVLSEVREYIYILSETPSFIANRIDTAATQYYQQLLPPYFKTLKEFTEDGDYYWDCPGHMGGMAYMKHPVGVEFLQFFGENMMRADIGVATSEMGDYLEHSGPPKTSEEKAAEVFGSDWTFYGVGGSSASNRIVAQGAIGADEICIVDRNCHKSLNHGLTLSHGRPVYLSPTRNVFGMIGPIPTHRLQATQVQGLINNSKLTKEAVSQEPSYAVVTNCTYDGFCYNVDDVVKALGASVPRIHFDEAWFAYAKLHPLYKNRFGMDVSNDLPDRPTIFAVHSTHKMLPALSMASMIHVKKSERAPLDYHDFNDAFMMHGTTSPYYPIIASIDVAVSMMSGRTGETLIQESIEEAISFRKAVVTISRKLKEKHGEQDWFFDVLQPRHITDPKSGEKCSFEDAPVSVLSRTPECWKLDPNEDWHGFSSEDIKGTDCMLDPVKVTITCPGITTTGQVEDRGIPGYVLTKFLDGRRTETARTGDYTLLILFSVGTTKGKWGTLLESLLEFKRLYDSDATLLEAIPDLAKESPAYSNMTLKDLCDRMHQTMRDLSIPEQLDKAVSAESVAEMTPAEAFQKVVRYKAEPVRVSDFAGRIAASMLVPYPPGIPLLMPGERVAAGNTPIVEYLLALQEFDKAFPGFEHEVHGVRTDDDGNFWVRAIVEEDREPKRVEDVSFLHVPSTSSKKGRQ